MANKVKALDALDKAEAASIRASMHLHAARSALREDGNGEVKFSLGDARDEVTTAGVELEVAASALEPDGDST